MVTDQTAATFTRTAAAMVAENDRVPTQRTDTGRVPVDVTSLRLQCPTCGVPIDVLAHRGGRLVKADPCGHTLRVNVETGDFHEANAAAIMHELETPLRGHDPDGACCREAQRSVGGE